MASQSQAENWGVDMYVAHAARMVGKSSAGSQASPSPGLIPDETSAGASTKFNSGFWLFNDAYSAYS